MNWPVDEQSFCPDLSTTAAISPQLLLRPLVPVTASQRLPRAPAEGEHVPSMKTAAAHRWAMALLLPDVAPLAPAVTAPRHNGRRRKNSCSYAPGLGTCFTPKQPISYSTLLPQSVKAGRNETRARLYHGDMILFI